jgi:hypothetical protein
MRRSTPHCWRVSAPHDAQEARGCSSNRIWSRGAAREVLAEALLSGKAWEDFCDRLKAAGRFVQAVDSIDRERDIAEGYRYLTRLARMGLGMILENGTPAAPRCCTRIPR